MGRVLALHSRRSIVAAAAAAAVCAAALLLGAPGPARAQETRHEGTVWLAYMNQTAVTPKWGIWFDTHYNPRAFFVVRGGLSYNLDWGPGFTAGYAFLLTDPGDGSLTRHEHRPWAQMVFPIRFSDEWGFSQRVRSDFRFQESVEDSVAIGGWDFTVRLRWQTALTYWLPEMSFGRFLVQIADEVLVNFGPSAGPNLLDQNRASLLFGVKVGRVTIRAGYMNRFIPGASGTMPVHEHAAILWLNHIIPVADMPDRNPEEGNP